MPEGQSETIEGLVIGKNYYHDFNRTCERLISCRQSLSGYIEVGIEVLGEAI